MSETANYGLYITDDSLEKFLDWRKQMNGTEDSNMTKIDAALAELANNLSGCKVISVTDDGYTEISGLRQAVGIDFSLWASGAFTETLEGGITIAYTVTFDDNGYPISINNGSVDCVITWPTEEA